MVGEWRTEGFAWKWVGFPSSHARGKAFRRNKGNRDDHVLGEGGAKAKVFYGPSYDIIQNIEDIQNIQNTGDIQGF